MRGALAGIGSVPATPAVDGAAPRNLIEGAWTGAWKRSCSAPPIAGSARWKPAARPSGLRCPAWTASVRFDDEETPLADILSALSAAKLLADANPSDATLDNLACDLPDGPFAETARLLVERTKTIVPERLDALVINLAKQ